MKLYFITGNEKKMREARSVIGNLLQLNIDVPEIQELDSRKVIEAKLVEAKKRHDGQFVVEDTSLHLDCLGGLPGPFIKWFMQTMGAEGIWSLAEKHGNYVAYATATVGYSDGEKTEFFEGRIDGEIVAPRGDKSFGWDPVFMPKGHDRTLAQMEEHEKNAISHRGTAFEKLRVFLEEKN